jgi:membrane-associated phospholipid phosphatase
MILLDSGVHPGFLQKILQIDYWLFSRINQEWTHPSLDTVFVFLREAELWVPFYLFLLVFITLNFPRKGWWWSISLILTAIISDLVSSHLMKYLVFRLRPCQNPLLADSMRFLANYCPSSSSFTSSHACNHFALAFFLFFTLRSTSRWWWLVFPWAFLISYAQVYVGVHYPLDVFGGALLGAGIGLTVSRLFRMQFGALHLQPYNSTHA